MSKGNIDSQKLKVVEKDLEVEFEIEYSFVNETSDVLDRQEIDKNLDEINQSLSSNNERIDELNIEIDRLTNNADNIDNIVAVCSGVLAGIVDSLWVGEFKFERGKAWSNETVNNFVLKTAKRKGYKGERLNGAIKFLEGNFKIPSDNIWKGINNGIGSKSHHLDDLAHHPTPLGLFISILTQFTEKGYFQNSEGDFSMIAISEDGKKLIGNSFKAKIGCGFFNWFFHLISDISGSSKFAGTGMGIPGPLVSLLKEASLIPGLNNSGLPKKIKDLFIKERFDFRSELAVRYELGRQTVPVIFNEVLVRMFYFIRRLIFEFKEKGSFQKICWRNILPWKNRTIVRMLTISTATFTVIDLGDAALRGAINSKGNKALFVKEFLLRVNFVGIGRFAIAIGTDVYMGYNRNALRNERMGIFSEQLHLMNAKIYYKQANVWITAKNAEETINEAYEMMERTSAVYVDAWIANRESMIKIGEYKEGIEKQNPKLIVDISDVLKG